jgi:DNA-binding MurR/RpiR family transcriptional regulator
MNGESLEAPDIADIDVPSIPPRDLHELRALMAERQGKLPKRLLKAGEFLLAHPNDVALGTASEIAAQADVQSSTLVRFAQALGYPGFTELRAVFRSHAREQWPDYGDRLRALRDTPSKRGPAALLSGFARAAMASIERVDSATDPAVLEHAVEVLAMARTIHLIGARRAFPVVSYLAYALGKLGIVAQLIDQIGGLAPERVDLIADDEAVLAVSFAPYTPATVELTSRAAGRGLPVVAVTDSPFSPLVQPAKVWLEVAEADHAAFRSLSGTFVLAMTLAVAIAERRQRDGSSQA